jgi:transposase
MANKPIDMKKIQTVLRLHFKQHSFRTIAKACGISKTTVRKYIELYERSNISARDVEELGEKDLADYFIEKKKIERNPRLQALEAFFPYVHKELRKTGVTRKLLWEEYLTKHPDGYRQSQFCEYYRRWMKRVSPTMHVVYKAGDKMLVDYCGKKLSIVDPETGEVSQAEVFVSILGASQLLYVQASASQKKEDFIDACEQALLAYGGVPRAIVTDNLKSAVTKSHRYEPQVNPDFADFADHYNMAVLPTRAYRPKDKALVEGAVRIIYTEIYARLRTREFNDLKSLNEAIHLLLEGINRRRLSARPYSRREFFEEVEAETLSPLPKRSFELRTRHSVTVLQNGHVHLKEDKHYYSVPYTYIRKKVQLTYTSKEVRIYYKYRCIALHPRTRSPFNYTTEQDHLASSHRQYTKWNATYFLNWAESINPVVKAFIEQILHRQKHPEQAYRSCIGILNLKKKVGPQRLIRVCSIALDCQRYSYGAVVDLLDRGIDKLELPEEPKALPNHHNIRGKDYYQPSKNTHHE